MSDSPAPKPRPVPRPGATPQPGTQPVAPVARDRKAELEKARAFGRVDENNTVFVKVVGGEREVGQYPDADNERALNYFAKNGHEVVSSSPLVPLFRPQV